MRLSEKASTELREFSAEPCELSTELREFSAEPGESSIELREFSAELGEFSTELREFSAELGESSTELRELNTKRGKLSSELAESSLSELRVFLSGLCVETVSPPVQPIFNAEFAEADAEIAEKKLIVFHMPPRDERAN